jgi:hypothetical protein
MLRARNSTELTCDRSPPDQEAIAPKSEPVAKPRFFRVMEEHLDEFLEYVSRRFIVSERFRVDQVVGHGQVVVTALNEILPDSAKYMGIAQLGGGRLAPVLNIPEIVKSLL